MIFFRPTTIDATVILFEAIEDDNICGKCTLNIDGNKAKISDVTLKGKKTYLAEGLIKSAFNYACIKNCYMGYCECGDISHLLDKMNFQKADGLYFNDIPSILTGNCCKDNS